MAVPAPLKPLTAVQTGRGSVGGGERQGEKVKASQAARPRQGEEQVKARSRVTDRPTLVSVSALWT